MKIQLKPPVELAMNASLIENLYQAYGVILHIKDSILVQRNKTVTTKENCACTHWVGIDVGGFVLKQCVL